MSPFVNVLSGNDRTDRRLERAMAAVLLLLSAAPLAALTQAVVTAGSSPALVTWCR